MPARSRRASRIVRHTLVSSAFAGAAGAVPNTGLIPLTELVSGAYQGFEGGLYAGSNTPPPGHAAAAVARAAQVQPRDPTGAPDPDGLVGLISIGMSNANQEFKLLERDLDADPTRNARLVIVNGAVGGYAAEMIRDPMSPYWTILDERLQTAGVAPEQVQVAWLKQVQGNPPTDVFPTHATNLQDDLRAIVRHLKATFPNLELCYLSTRIYGGHSSDPRRTEPLSYETGFAVKWLLEDQIGGDPALNHEPSAGPVQAPLLLWGPYLWADGDIPRSDGLTWLLADFESDLIHPSAAGERKAADLLVAFFNGEPSAASWLAADPSVRLLVVTADADASVDSSRPDASFGTLPELRVDGMQARSILRFDLTAVASPILHAKLSLRATSEAQGQLDIVSDDSWNETTVTYNTAPAVDGGPIGPLAFWSRDSSPSADVTAAVLGEADGVITIALSQSPALHQYLSRESTAPPRLVLTLGPAPTGIGGRIPNGAEAPGAPLLAVKRPGGDVRLTWSSSCNAADADYAVYEGAIGQADSHQPATCTTGAATDITIPPTGPSTYFLVVPHDSIAEGGYGATRPPAAPTCLPVAASTCR